MLLYIHQYSTEPSHLSVSQPTFPSCIEIPASFFQLSFEPFQPNFSLSLNFAVESSQENECLVMNYDY